MGVINKQICWPEETFFPWVGFSTVSRLMRGLFCTAVYMGAMALPVPAQNQPTPSATGAKSGNHPVHIVAKSPGKQSRRVGSGPSAPFCFGACSFQYYGGPVISNVDVVVVYWGSQISSVVNCGGGTDSHGNCIGVSQFFSAVSDSTFIDMLGEYNAAGVDANAGSRTGLPGTNQTVGRGSLHAGSPFVITVSASNSGTIINDSNIQNEIQTQIANGVLPAPASDAGGDVNTLYMVYFPPGLVISDPSIGTSCVDFCAYHSTYNLNALDVPYGVIPDFGKGGGCGLGCGSGTEFENITSVSSHELAEAITDTAVGIGTTLDYPLAWYDANNGEIGDPCNGNTGTLQLDSIPYVVQQEFSQSAYDVNPNGGCVSPPQPAFILTAPSTGAPGAAFSVTVNASNSDSRTYLGTVHFTSTDATASLPADYTFSAGDAGAHTFTNSVTLHQGGADKITVTDAHQPSTPGSATVNVKLTTATAVTSNLNPSTFGQSVTFTAAVSSSGGTPSGNVTFKSGTKALGASALVGGVTSFSTSSLGAGMPTITAVYNGSSKFSASSGSVLQTVNKASTTTTITGASLNPSTFGDSVTFTASVTTGAGAGTPTGSVSFMRGASTLGKGTLISGTASFTTKSTQLPAGTDLITAVYGGDSNRAGSTSPADTQNVNKATTTTQIIANPTTITSGSQVTLTATVTATPSSTPTGTVIFSDGTITLGSVNLVNGAATLITTGIIGTGQHTIKGRYKGTSNYLSSFGTVVVTVR